MSITKVRTRLLSKNELSNEVQQDFDNYDEYGFFEFLESYYHISDFMRVDDNKAVLTITNFFSIIIYIDDSDNDYIFADLIG